MGANLVTVDFLELQRDSRVTTGNSGCLLCWPREVQSSIRVVKESWGLLSSDCRANRPHLGLCPEANVPLQGRQGRSEEHTSELQSPPDLVCRLLLEKKKNSKCSEII